MEKSDDLSVNEQIIKLIESTTFSDINNKINKLLNSNKKLIHYTSIINIDCEVYT